MSPPLQPDSARSIGHDRPARPHGSEVVVDTDGSRQDHVSNSNLDWMISRDLRIVSLSPGLSRMLDIDHDGESYGDLERIIFEPDRDAVLSLIEDITTGALPSGAVTFTLLAARGPVKVTALVSSSSQDGTMLVLALAQDTPDRLAHPEDDVEAEWAPAHGDEAAFRFVLGTSPHLAAIGRSVFWMTGFSRDELLAAPDIFHSLPHPADQSAHQRIFLDPGADPFDVKLRWIHRNGTERWIQLAGHPVEDSQGHIVELRGSIRDITDQVNLQVMDRVRTAALRAAANAVVIANAEGIIEWVNPAFTKLTGFEKNEVIGERPNVLRSGTHDDAFYKDMWETILSGNIWKGDLVNRRKDGSTYHEEMTITPVRDFTGAITRFIAIKQDISERKEQENQLRLASQRAKEAAAFKANLLNNVSHEVMTPITAILSLSEILREETSSELSEFASEIHHHGARLRESLANVLDLSRLQTSDFTLSPEWMTPLDTVRRVMRRFETLVDHDQIEIRVSGSTDKVWMDENAVRRIVVNLVSNAIRFTEAGLISVDASLIDDELTIVVADTGCGVEPSFIPRMFDEFRQESSGLDREHPGNGLGLSVVKRLVRLCHGSVEVVSQKDLGTSVTVRIPHLPPS